MASSPPPPPPSFLIFFSFLLSTIFTSSLTVAQPDTYQFPPRFSCRSQRGNYTANSTYDATLTDITSLLSGLIPNDYGFYIFSDGGAQGEDVITAMALCRPEVKPSDCISCINTAGKTLREKCPTQKEAISWYTHCMFRYSNRSILSTVELAPDFGLCSEADITGDKAAYLKGVRDMLDGLRRKAAAGGSTTKYATGNLPAPAFNETFYGLVQCTPDLSEADCNSCLTKSFDSNLDGCDGKIGSRWFNPSCNFRYETSWQFYNREFDPLAKAAVTPSPAASPSPTKQITTNSKGKKNDTSRTVIAVVVPIVAAIIFSSCLYVVLWKRKKQKQKRERFHWCGGEDAGEIISAESLQLNFSTVKAATDDFDLANKLGEGGFGAVYKGKNLDGQEIAVKRLSRSSVQGNTEFKNEVLLVAKLQHRNLVRLIGFSLEGEERLLIYEFVPNSSLDHYLFDPIKRSDLNWETRYKIIEGVGRGLLYLHQDSRLQIIHRDLKASNILLTEDMTPKIADFGTARLFDVEQATQIYTNRIVGTYGYMAPEYAMHGQFSVKTDVFSFGVLVLEIISGQRNNCFQNGENVEDLLSFAWGSWREGNALNLVDPSLTSGSRSEMMRCIHIALLCVQEDVASRPTMGLVVLMLSSTTLTLETPSQPAFFIQRNAGANVSSSSGVTESINDVSITELYPR